VYSKYYECTIHYFVTPILVDSVPMKHISKTTLLYLVLDGRLLPRQLPSAVCSVYYSAVLSVLKSYYSQYNESVPSLLPSHMCGTGHIKITEYSFIIDTAFAIYTHHSFPFTHMIVLKYTMETFSSYGNP